MSFSLAIPALSDLRRQTAAAIDARLQTTVDPLRRRNIRVAADVFAGLLWGEYSYLAQIPAMCLFVSTAVAPYLDRRANELGLTRGGTATAAGKIIFAGTSGITIPAGTYLQIASLGSDAFLAAALALLPPGDAWPASLPPLGELAVQAAFWAAVADQMAALHATAGNFTEVESDPGQTLQLLEAWETDYGLPDSCTPAAPTLSQRHAALLAKIAAQGLPVRRYFVAVAAALGYAVTIAITAPNQWTVNAPDVTINYFRAGEASAGEPLAWANAAPLECRLRRIVPSWIELLFSYS